MSKRIDKSWVVFASIENEHHDRCVDLFLRSDGSFGFEEFRRDVEDGGAWTPTECYSTAVLATASEMYEAAAGAVAWLGEALRKNPALRKMPAPGRIRAFPDQSSAGTGE